MSRCRATPRGTSAGRPTCSSNRATARTCSPFSARCPTGTPLFWLGLGSNLLVRDGGIRGVVIDTAAGLTRLERVSDTTLTCEAGVPCARLARQCHQVGPRPRGVPRGHSRRARRSARDERRRFRRRNLAARALGRRLRCAWQCDAAATRANTRFGYRQHRRRPPRASSSSPRCSSSSRGPDSPTRRCASCSRSAKRRSPSASGAVDRRSPIRPAITPRG